MTKKVYAGTSKQATQVEDGVYPAILSQIIMVGGHKFTSKNGKEFVSPQVIVGFELPTLTYENDGLELTTIKSWKYFLSMNPSYNGQIGLREVIDGFHGAEYTEAEGKELEEGAFDVAQYLGKPCLLTIAGVESKGRVYSSVTDVNAEAAKDLKIEAKRTPILITTEDFVNIDNLEIPQWIKDVIMESEEYKNIPKTAPINDQFEEKEEIKIDDIPF